MIHQGVNYYEICGLFNGTDEDFIFLTYVMLRYGREVGKRLDKMKRRLNLWRIDEQQLIYCPWDKYSFKSALKCNNPESFVSPIALTYKWEVPSKRWYIETAMKVTLHARREHKLWKKPILVPKILTGTAPKDIPAMLVEDVGENYRLNLEERYYG